MNLKALITTFVLGSSSVASSVAMAHPAAPAPAPAPASIIRDHRAAAAEDCAPSTLPAAPVYQAPVYQIPRAPAPVYTPAVYQPEHHRDAWLTLGSVNRVTDGQLTFRVRRGEQLSKLKLQSDAGKALIQRVLIQFANGRTQTVELNRYLNAANPTIMIDLAGRERTVTKVTVIGRNARQSAYRVLAT